VYGARVTHRRESPVRRENPSGAVRWKARYTNPQGRRVSAGTYARKGPCRDPRDDGTCCAQHAIDHAYGQPLTLADAELFGTFAATWTARYPRAGSTNDTNGYRIASVLDVQLAGRKLRDWPYRDLKRRHAVDLLAYILTEHGRAAEGARGVMRVLSAMTEDAITEEVCDTNPFMGVKIRDDDPRVSKPARQPRVYTFRQMRNFAAKSPNEAAIRVLCDCGVRLGELFGLEHGDYDGKTLAIRGNVRDGVFVAGDTSTKHHVRVVPVGKSTAALLDELQGDGLLFPTAKGGMWWARNFYRQVWDPARVKVPAMAAATPHDFRHSWVSIMRAKGVDLADLAQIAGHSVETQTGIYTHALNRSAGTVRKIVG
jgi:integrase